MMLHVIFKFLCSVLFHLLYSDHIPWFPPDELGFNLLVLFFCTVAICILKCVSFWHEGSSDLFPEKAQDVYLLKLPDLKCPLKDMEVYCIWN